MERSKMRRSIWRSNFWRLAAIFIIFIIGLQAVQTKKSENDNDIIFDDSPLDISEGWRSLHKRSMDNDDDDDSHWLWSNVNRIKRSIHGMLQSSESKTRAKRGLWDDWFITEKPKTVEKETAVEYSTEYTTEIIEDTEEQNDHSNNLKPLDEPDDDEFDNEINGSGTQEPEFTNDGKLERFFRLILTLEEIWSPDFKDPSTAQYKTKAHEIEKSLENYYRNENMKSNSITARVVQIRLPAPNQMFSISVMTDIKSERPITYNDLNVVIKKAIKNHALGDLTVKENGYSLTVVKVNLNTTTMNRKLSRKIRNVSNASLDELDSSGSVDGIDDTIDETIDENNVDILLTDDIIDSICGDLFECKTDHKCISYDKYCDGLSDCDDNSDESECASTPAIPFSILTTTMATTTTKRIETSTQPITTTTTITQKIVDATKTTTQTVTSKAPEKITTTEKIKTTSKRIEQKTTKKPKKKPTTKGTKKPTPKTTKKPKPTSTMEPTKAPEKVTPATTLKTNKVPTTKMPQNTTEPPLKVTSEEPTTTKAPLKVTTKLTTPKSTKKTTKVPVKMTTLKPTKKAPNKVTTKATTPKSTTKPTELPKKTSSPKPTTPKNTQHERAIMETTKPMKSKARDISTPKTTTSTTTTRTTTTTTTTTQKSIPLKLNHPPIHPNNYGRWANKGETFSI